MNKISSFFWTLGLLFALIKNFLELFKILKSKIDNKESEKLLFEKLLDIVAKLGDLVNSLNGLEVPLMLTGKGLNDGVLAAGGLTSAVIGIYSTWK